MARDFNGSTDRIDYANVADTTGQAQTWAAWAWIDAVGGANQHLWLSHSAGDANYAAALQFAATTGRFRLTCRGTTVFFRVRTLAPATGAWVHLLMTWDGSVTAANCHLYVNGSEGAYSTTTDGAALVAGTGSWSLGGRIWADSQNFDGKLAGVGWWNRILTAEEIAGLAAKWHPWCFPRGLMFAPDLDGFGSVNCPRSGKTATLDGTSVANHPPLIYPSSPLFVAPVGGAPPAFGGRTHIIGGGIAA